MGGRAIHSIGDMERKNAGGQGTSKLVSADGLG